jgi:parvulin-like peptidyl-prolyl isomerase
VVRLFGHTQFADALFKAPVGKWSGPFHSAYGWHLIYIDARKSEESPALSTVREAVRTDFLQDAQDKENRAAFADLARQYTIVREDRKAVP